MEGEGKEQQTDWENLSDTQLTDALTRRGLNTDGEKDEIIQRLQEYDASKVQHSSSFLSDAPDAFEIVEDKLETEEADTNEVLMMTDQQIQEIVDKPAEDVEEGSKDLPASPDSIVILDEVEADTPDDGGEEVTPTEEKIETKEVNGEVQTSEEAATKMEEGKESEKDGKADATEKKSESQDKEEEKEKPILMKNRMLYGYLCCNAVKSVIVTPFKKELMSDEVFATWLDEASSFHIRKGTNGTSGVLLRFPTLDKGDSACCALKVKLASYDVEVYHPNKDVFSSSRNSWTNLIKDVQNPQETLFNRLLILENIPESHNTDEKLCELFPGAIDVVSFQFDPGCNGIAVVEFFQIKEAADFVKKVDGQIEIEGEIVKIYKYDLRHPQYTNEHMARSETAKQKEIPPLADEDRKKMTEEYKAIKTELDNLQNSDTYFAVEKVSRFVELDNKVNDMVRILTNDTTRRFNDGATEMPEGADNMLTCVRNTLAKMQNKIDTAKAKGTYNPGHDAGGGGARSERYTPHGRGGARGGGGRGGGNKRYEDPSSFKRRVSQGDGGWRTMARDYSPDHKRHRGGGGGGGGRGGGGRRDRSPVFRRDRSPGGFKGGYPSSSRRAPSPSYRRNRSPDYRRERSPMYRGDSRSDYGRGWGQDDRRARSPGGYRREMSPLYGRGWSPEYRGARPEYERNPVHTKLEDKDFRNKGEGANPTSKVLQEFTAVLADKVRSLEQLQQQTLQAQLLGMGGNSISNPGMPGPPPPNMANMGSSHGYGGSSQYKPWV